MKDFAQKMQRLRVEADRMQVARKQCINRTHQFRRDLQQIGLEMQREANQQQNVIRQERSERRRALQVMQKNILAVRLHTLSVREQAHRIWFRVKSV